MHLSPTPSLTPKTGEKIQEDLPQSPITKNKYINKSKNKNENKSKDKRPTSFQFSRMVTITHTIEKRYHLFHLKTMGDILNLVKIEAHRYSEKVLS